MATIAELAEEAAALTALAADLNDGTVSWQEWDADLTCDDRQFAAYEEALTAAAAAWADLEAAERAEQEKGVAA
jgi:hypothetical protein